MNVQIYSKQPLPRDFCLREDPYVSESAREILKSLGAVFYRDQYHGSNGVVLETMKGPAFYSQLILNRADYSVNNWKKIPAKQKIEFPNDKKAWIKYNSQVVIGHIAQDSVLNL